MLKSIRLIKYNVYNWNVLSNSHITPWIDNLPEALLIFFILIKLHPQLWCKANTVEYLFIFKALPITTNSSLYGRHNEQLPELQEKS